MKATIHQPTFLPYLGFFRKAAQTDIFIVYDTAQYSHRNWHNRNRILNPNGVQWLTVPVSAAQHDTFRTARPTDRKFIEKHLTAIEEAYRNAPFFRTYFPELRRLYEQPFSSLAEFNWRLTSYLFGILRIETKVIFASDLPDLHGTKSTDALIVLLRNSGASLYISGVDGAHYLETEKFAENGIELVFNDFIARPYPQQFSKEFIPNLSVIDALMNVGAEGVRTLIST